MLIFFDSLPYAVEREEPCDALINSLTDYAYAAALDLHAIQIGERTFSFDQAKVIYRDRFEKYIFLNDAEITRIISEEEYTQLEVAKLGASVFDCR